MLLIPDDPIIHSMEMTGYPSWIDADYEEIDEGESPDEESEDNE